MYFFFVFKQNIIQLNTNRLFPVGFITINVKINHSLQGNVMTIF